MSKVQAAPLNSIDLVFRDKSEIDIPVMKQGLLQVYGKDNDVSYLITKVKLSKEITVDRDVDGHLTWNVGGKVLKIGSSFWVRVKHAIKSFFSKAYTDAHQIKVSNKIKRVVRAYTTLIANEKETKNQDILRQRAVLEDELTALQTALTTQNEALEIINNNYDEKVNFLEWELKPFEERYKAYIEKADLWDQYIEIVKEKSQEANQDLLNSIEAVLGNLTTKANRAKAMQTLSQERDKLDEEELRYGSLDSDTLQSEVDALKDSRTELENAISDLNTQIQTKCDEIALL